MVTSLSLEAIEETFYLIYLTAADTCLQLALLYEGTKQRITLII